MDADGGEGGGVSDYASFLASKSGAELKASYYAQAVANLKHAAAGDRQVAMFGAAS